MTSDKEEPHWLIKGGVLAIITPLGAVLVTALMGWLNPTFGAWLLKVLQGSWTVLVSPYAIPGWLVFIALGVAAWAIFQFLRQFLQPTWVKRYRMFIFDGVRWRWSYKGEVPSGITPYCMQCDTELVIEELFIRDLGNCTNLRCQRRGKVAVLTEPNNLAMGSIKREIERRIRAKEWKADVTMALKDRT